LTGWPFPLGGSSRDQQIQEKRGPRGKTTNVYLLTLRQRCCSPLHWSKSPEQLDQGPRSSYRIVTHERSERHHISGLYARHAHFIEIFRVYCYRKGFFPLIPQGQLRRNLASVRQNRIGHAPTITHDLFYVVRSRVSIRFSRACHKIHHVDQRRFRLL